MEGKLFFSFTISSVTIFGQGPRDTDIRCARLNPIIQIWPTDDHRCKRDARRTDTGHTGKSFFFSNSKDQEPGKHEMLRFARDTTLE